MRANTIVVAVALTLIVCDAVNGVAQTIWPGYWPTRSYFGDRAMGQPLPGGMPAPAMFGDPRVLGQTLRPAPTRFAGIVPTPVAPPMAVGIYNGGLYPIPVQPIGTQQLASAVVDQTGAVITTPQPTVNPLPAAGLEAAPTGPYPGAEMPPGTVPGATAPEGTAPYGATPGAGTTTPAAATTNGATPATATAASGATAATASILPGSSPHRWPSSPGGRTPILSGPLVPLPELSARVTRLARSRGMQTTGINVSVSNGTAVLQGTIDNAGDRAVLSNVVALEPGIWQVINRLSAPGEPVTARVPTR